MAKKQKIIKEKNLPESKTPVHSRRYEALIFITGAVTLALEVLASRIMTPYFGVSLYIWAGILSITLIFLALGYQLGGQISQRREKDALQFLLLAAPLAGSLSVVLATVIYPVVFPLLSTINLIIASFLGGTILLALPLMVLSAMNPLLIAYGRDPKAGGDGGAGRIFFISTVGSVAGVLLTAFLLIPHLTNFRALLWLSLGLGLVAGGLVFFTQGLSGRHKRLLVGGGMLVLLLSSGMLLAQGPYFKLLAGMSDIGKDIKVLAEYTSMFGNIKVLEVYPENRERKPATAYLQDGIIQNMVESDGTVLDHTEFMLRLKPGLRPQGWERPGAGHGSGDHPPQSPIAGAPGHRGGNQSQLPTSRPGIFRLRSPEDRHPYRRRPDLCPPSPRVL